MVFPIPNETSTEQDARLKKIPRQVLIDNIKSTIERVKQKHKDLPVEFIVQTRPFSTNKMSGARKTFETKSYLEFREIIAKKAGGTYGFTGKEKVRLVLEAGFSNKRGDLDNCMKPLLDSIVACVDDAFDDSQVYAIEAKKKIVAKGQEYLKVRLEVLDEKEYASWWS